MSDAEAECFVCLSGKGTLLTGICLCRTLAIHKSCQQKLVRSKASTVCGVCKAPYRNVTITSTRRLRPRVVAMMCLCWFNTCICLSAGIYLSSHIGDPSWMPSSSPACSPSPSALGWSPSTSSSRANSASRTYR